MGRALELAGVHPQVLAAAGLRVRRLLMDWDDPEKRIADLERLAGGPMSAARGELTADDVHNVAFSAPPRGKRGYDVGGVEAFRRRLEEYLRNPHAGGLTAAEVDSVAFSKPPIGERGYDQHEVDAFLARAVQQLKPDVSQPASPAAPDDFRGHTGKRSKSRRVEWAVLPLAILMTVLSLVAFGVGVYDVYGYRVGTPTTAKVVSCSGGRNKFSNVICTGQWSVGGKSYTGRIAGDSKGRRVGSSLDVRVHGGSAYTATSGNMWFTMGTGAGLLAVMAFLVTLFAGPKSTDAAPTAGRHSLR